MMILALDPATYCGWALGEPGAMPLSGTVRLKKPGESVDVAAFNMGALLRDKLRDTKVDLICIEHFLNPAVSSSHQSTIMAICLYGVVAAFSGLYGITLTAPTPAEVRQYVCGKATATPPRKRGSPKRTAKETAAARAATKQMVIDRCKLLKLIPQDCRDDNRADACAIWFYACGRYARWIQDELVMFEELVS